MTSHPIEAVIFDADGTLIDSEAPGLDVLHTLMTEEGVAITHAAVHQQFRGMRMSQVVEWVAQQLNITAPSFHADFTARVRRAMAERFRAGLSPMPGARELLQDLALPFCVATNGPREKVELTLAVSGLAPLVQQRVYCAPEVGSFKPEPGLFLHAAEKLGAPAQRCAVVEDSLPGITAGLAAQMQVYSLYPRAELPPALAARVVSINSPGDLRALLPAGACR